MNPFGNSRHDNQQRRGCGGRLMMALLIAVVGFFMYYNNVQENPVTGQKQHVSMTPADEIKIGLQSAPEMASQMGGAISSTDPRAQLVQKIGNQIIQNSQGKKGPWKFQFHLLADPKTINAFALPGGQIFITLGLFNQLQTEGQLAGVLSHEMGHVIQRHAAQQLAKGQLGQLLVVATQVGTSDSQGTGAAMIANVINQMMQLRYSRGDELEADQWGLMLMSEAGYDPKAMLEVMKILERASGSSGKGPEMLMTHPYPENRIQQINEYLSKNPSKGNLTEGRNLKDILQQQGNRGQTQEESLEDSFFRLFQTR